MLESVNWPSFLAGFLTCVVLQWLWASYWISDWLLRLMRKRRLADVLGWIAIAALVLLGGWFAVTAVGDALMMMAANIRGRY